MTKSRDVEALLVSYLEEGMEVLPDRVVDAVLDKAHRSRQRAPFGPRRILDMPRFALTAAGTVAVLALSAAGWQAFGPGTHLSDPSPSPSASVSPTPSAFPDTAGDLIVGATYRASTFSQPLTLTIPVRVNEIGSATGGLFDRVTGSIEDQGRTLRIDFSPTSQSITIHDDATVNVDPCNPSDLVQEIPSTPEAVGEWLHGIGGLEVRDGYSGGISGGTFNTYDVTTAPSCGDAAPAGKPDIVLQPGEQHRIWAISTAADTILVVEWYRADDRWAPILIQGIASRLVFSLRFD